MRAANKARVPYAVGLEAAGVANCTAGVSVTGQPLMPEEIRKRQVL